MPSRSPAKPPLTALRASLPVGVQAASGPQIIGWKERIGFPDWHIANIVAKADTGARTGAIDVAEVMELPNNRVRFVVRLRRGGVAGGQVSRHIEANISRRSRVRSAFGHAHDRLFILVTMRVGGVEKQVELGLVSRKKMICRVLLGRKALEGDFLVDSHRRYLLSGRRKLKRPPQALPATVADGVVSVKARRRKSDARKEPL